ncbi:MAG: hypothetical protein QOE70_503 [Chthoniobacter sp.]|nr:hypothetical protein [Chthoniobacter sp.]
MKSYQPPNIWEPVGFKSSTTRYYKQDSGDALYRRSIYSFLKRTAPPPFLANFDAPSRENFCTRRERSDTPLQALQLLNDVQYFEAARALSQRILHESGTAPEARLEHAFHVVLTPPPEPREVERLRALEERFLAKYQADPAAAQALLANGESKPAADRDPAELAAWTKIAQGLGQRLTGVEPASVIKPLLASRDGATSAVSRELAGAEEM